MIEKITPLIWHTSPGCKDNFKAIESKINEIITYVNSLKGQGNPKFGPPEINYQPIEPIMATLKKEKSMDSSELFREKQAEMSDKELIELCDKEVTKLAESGGRSHTMCVPPAITDTDMLFCELIRRYKEVCDKV